MVGHPLDLIKVRMQTGVGGGSVLGMMGKTLRAEGFGGLYRGVSAPLTAVTPLFAVCFWGYDMGKRCVRLWESKVMKREVTEFTIPQYCVAGGISAIPASLLMAPSERIKCLLQIQTNVGGVPKYNGMLDCAAKVYQEGGIRSLFRGFGATLLRDVPGSVVWFGVYEFAKKEMLRFQGHTDKAKLSPMAILTAGGLAGMANWTICIPADVIKSRFQTAPEGMYNGLWDVYRDLMAKEGPAALFRGIRPALIRAFPANAACFFGMEVGQKLLSFLD
eukprot:CAMPEP_0116830928 /NCGR_PEP_ID=MMETSP0418-20121206/5044_1 /TAXON_ID=1158023 /ORGANISM="Astrosyne radiata, Strain 13vi08-1A" /LENGTH=274 /DNA_ID=CAMNT_0004460103 /DNA_START=131 /DNA_END=955 /DNA_ORIENTATION=+